MISHIVTFIVTMTQPFCGFHDSHVFQDHQSVLLTFPISVKIPSIANIKNKVFQKLIMNFIPLFYRTNV